MATQSQARRIIGVFVVVALVLVLSLGLLVPEAAAKPTVIGNCRTLAAPGSYILKQNLTTVGTCIVIGADFVTLDLDGQTLTGNGTGVGIYDNGVARKGTAVRNGTVTGFGVGIDLSASAGSVIERIRAAANGTYGIHAGAPSTITGNTAGLNGSTGILAGNDSLISGNIAGGNGGDGIACGNHLTITRNSVTGNGSNGIGVGTSATLTGNTATNNSGNGIGAGDNSTLTGNTASLNGSGAFCFGGCSGITTGANCTFIGNTASNNSGDGFTPGQRSTMSNNTADNNTAIGINLSVGGGLFRRQC